MLFLDNMLKKLPLESLAAERTVLAGEIATLSASDAFEDSLNFGFIPLPEVTRDTGPCIPGNPLLRQPLDS